MGRSWLWGGLLAVLLFTAPPARALSEDAPPRLGLMVGLWTQHVDPGQDTNEKSRFVSLGYRGWYAAHFINSYDHDTWFAGRKFSFRGLRWPEEGPGLFLRPNLYLGLMYGYRELVNVGKLTPVIAPTGSLGWAFSDKNRVSVEGLYVPTGSGGVFLLVAAWEGDPFGT